MSEQPFMQLYVADYLADTLDLSTVEHGAYLLILMTMWRHDARLPNDMAKLARIARMSVTKFKPVWAEISRFFEVDGDAITNRRLSKEHEKARKKSEVRATAGKAGGHAKALKDKEAAYGNCHADAVASSSEARVRSQKEEDDDDDRRADASEPDGLMSDACRAAGVAFGSLTGSGGRFGMSPKEVDALRRWQQDLGLTPDQIIASITDQAVRLRSPPRSMTYFTPGLQQLAAELTAPPIAAAPTPRQHRPTGHGITINPEDFQ
ncbi:DUF1376 domain-containing protein [Paracoccus limosus]|uniref:DUF1376 domain-containing protein n=1 Tax=Paracoccus limosus TaxID=913252 RepID=A0A844GWM0_9RHOB|nr:DUF1376 domain-containing protein [Paracoccus limosus]MTH33049.1 DUF1376 domain-containing protein [Paracoccus limosus]